MLNITLPSTLDSAQDAHFGIRDLTHTILIPVAICTALATLTVVARWYTRARLIRTLGADDYIILFSLALSWTMTALIGLEVHHSLAIHDNDTDVPASEVAKLVVVNNDLWILLVNTTKVSILVQYLRLFSCARLRRACIALLVVLVPAVAWGVFGGTFLCTPISKLWNPTLPGTCMNARTYWLSVAGLDISLDFLILLLPLPAIAALRLPRKQKIGLLLVFLLGFFVCIVSVVRLLTVLITSLEGDLVTSGVWAIIWSAIEANVGIVCASLLALKPLVVKWFPNLMEETQVPRHSMRLPMVEAGVWPAEDVEPIVAAPPMSMPESRDDSAGKRPSSAWMSSQQSLWSPVRLSQVENLGIVEAEDVPVWSRTQHRLSIFDILQEDAEVARERIERKDSSFREHL